MKKCIHFLLIGLCLMIINGSCSDDDDRPEPELIVSTENIVLSKGMGDKVMHIKTNQKWVIASSESWCTVSPSSGDGTGTIKIIVSVTENTTNDVRHAVLSVIAGEITKQVDVTQQLTNLLVVAKTEYEVEAVGENITIELETTDSPEITINGDWILQSEAKTVSAISKIFIIAPNRNIFAREGSITFKVADLTETVIVRQTGTSLNIAADKTGMTSDATVLAENMGLGWNLGNTLEATDGNTAGETSWGNPKASKQLMDAVKAAGFNTVRIPCAWNAYIEDATTYKIKDSWLARVKEVVDYCVDNEMYAIINIHWDGGWLENNPTYDKQVEVNKKQKALWEQIAVYFRDYDEHLLFAGTNEVHANYNIPSAENIEVQESYNQTFVDAVRSTGGRNSWRNLVVQSYNTNIDYAVNLMTMPTDPTANRIMAEVHFYDPYEFCLQEQNTVFLWGKDFTGAGTASWGQEDWVDTQFGRIKTNFADKGIPVILGEYSPILRTSLGAADYVNHVNSRNYYLNYVTKAAVQNGIVPVYWDNGPTGDKASGLFNRYTGEQVHADAIEAIIDGGK